MTNFAEVLTVLAAGGGLALLLVMALVPLAMDRDRPARRVDVERRPELAGAGPHRA